MFVVFFSFVLYASASGYDFQRPGFEPVTGHFTQVVWKDSKVLGIGKAEGERHGLKCTYVVARYKPAGNFIGQFSENVGKGSFQKSSCDKLLKLDQPGNVTDDSTVSLVL